MKCYDFLVKCSYMATIEIQAETVEEALEIARDTDGIDWDRITEPELEGQVFWGSSGLTVYPNQEEN